jgi:hypothetical protein
MNYLYYNCHGRIKTQTINKCVLKLTNYIKYGKWHNDISDKG